MSGVGDCYPTAFHLVVDERPDALVVHGEVDGQGPAFGERFGHAWVEDGDTVLDYSNGLAVEMDRDRYYEVGGIDEAEVYRYDRREAMVEALRTGVYGPWADAELSEEYVESLLAEA
jgi:hypothetical protein